MKSYLMIAVTTMALGACAPHPSHPIVLPPPNYASTQPVPPQPHPEHPIAEPPPELMPPHPAHPIAHPLLAGFFAEDARDRWLDTPCQHATDGTEWCGHILKAAPK